MNHLKILGIKFTVIFIIVLSLFGIFDHTPLFNLFWMALFATLTAYFIGDLLFIKWFGNVLALIIDFGIAFSAFWFLSRLLIGAEYSIIPLSFFAAFLFICCELFIHGYVADKLPNTFKRNTRDTQLLKKLQTEFAEEPDVHTKKDID